ncbi:NAD(P)-dependent oxidoreductase [Azospirillum sp. ST 5-10]|uniref:NAD(P)-dependent oxidoreductase n=1 Tax=unclassified Azospirillum TaxID=2630922 RepID=UPI003F4A337B
MADAPPEVVISEFMDEAAVAGLAADHRVLYDPGLVDRPDELRRAVGAARALIVRNRTPVRAPLLDAAPHLVAVGRLGVGLDNIDVEACRARRVAVFPATGANDDSVAEYVIAGALVLLRGAYFATADVAAGRWPRERLIGREIAGCTLGLVGFGGIARATARRAAALGMAVQAYDPFVPADAPAWRELAVGRADLDTVLATSDVVSLHVPLAEGTRRLIDAAALARMRPDAVLVDAARGGVLDEAALAAALRAGRLGGALLDVFEREPLGPDNPFAGVPNLILTPHIAGVTAQSNRRVSAVTADAVRRALAARTEVA